MKNTFKTGVIALVLLALPACKKETVKPGSTEDTTDSVTLEIAHHWGTQPFALNTWLVNPHTGDSLNFAAFKYYVSNIRLKKENGSWWTQPESYFLLDLSAGTTPSIQLTGVPYGEYIEIEYTLGVDSTRNVSGAQTGALSPSHGMFWSWNSGYIMLKAEGISPDAAMGGSFAFHLGGFSGPNKVVTTKSHPFTGNSLSVTGNGNCQVQLSAAVETLWQTVGSVSANSMIHMPGSGAKTMADDFYGSFVFESIQE